MLFSARLCRVPLFTIVTLLRQHIIQLGNYNFTALVESEQNDLHECILNLFSPEGSVKGYLFHASGSLRSYQFKMLRLESCLEGEAAETVKGLGYSDHGYEAAKARLNRKYGVNRRQVQAHIDELP